MLGPSFANHDVKVFGTDVDEQAIVKARHAPFIPQQVDDVPPRILKEWFVEEAGAGLVAPSASRRYRLRVLTKSVH